MLNLLERSARTCEGISRRSMLQIGSLGGLGITLPFWLQQKTAARQSGSAVAGDVNCIFIWTHGGTSHHDTLDPKPEAPSAVRGPFAAIDTAIPGVQVQRDLPAAGGRGGAVRRAPQLESAERQPRDGRRLVHVGAEVQPGPALSVLRLGDQSAARALSRRSPRSCNWGRASTAASAAAHRACLGSSTCRSKSTPTRTPRTSPSATSRPPRDRLRAASIAARRCWRRSTPCSRRADLQPAEFAALDENYKAALQHDHRPRDEARLPDRRRRPAPARSLRPQPVRAEPAPLTAADPGGRAVRDA